MGILGDYNNTYLSEVRGLVRRAAGDSLGMFFENDIVVRRNEVKTCSITLCDLVLMIFWR